MFDSSGQHTTTHNQPPDFQEVILKLLPTGDETLCKSFMGDSCNFISAKLQDENSLKIWLEIAPWRRGKEQIGPEKCDESLAMSTGPVV